MTGKQLLDPTHAMVILNPVSGTKDPGYRRELLLGFLKQYKWKGELIETTPQVTAAAITSRVLKKGETHIVVCGGDGTIMEVIGEAIGKECVIGVVPFGTGNLFARNLSLPLATEEAVKTALFGKVKEIDVGRANNTYFTIMAGIGFDAEVMKGTKREVKKRLGVIAYLLTSLQKLQKKPGQYEIAIDGGAPKTYRAKSILIANMGRIQGGIKVVPKATPDSGTLRIGILHARSIREWLLVVLYMLRGQIHKSPHYTHLEGKDVQITTEKPTLYELDGNEFPPTKTLTVTILPLAVQVVTE